MLTRSYEAPAEIGQHHLIVMDTEHPLETTVVETLKALAQRTPCGAENEETECPI
jgi:hypothetical protein